MALSEYKLNIRVVENNSKKIISHELYDASTDIAGGMYAQLKDPDDNPLYLPITTNLVNYFSSPLRFRNKATGQIYAAKRVYIPPAQESTLEYDAYLYDLRGSVAWQNYTLGNFPFYVQNKSLPIKVTLKLTGWTNTWGGWANDVYTKIGVHIDGEPYLMNEAASYGKSGVINYNNAVIGDRITYILDAEGAHTIGLCIAANCSSKDGNACYVTSFEVRVEVEGD